MNWKQHLIGGFIISILFVVLMNWQFGWYPIKPVLLAQLILIIGISPLIPDLDHESSKLQQWLLGLGLIISAVGVIYWMLVYFGLEILGEGWQVLIVIGVVLAVAVFFNSQFANHRGFWHSISLCLIYAIFIFILTGFAYQLGIIAFIGCYSHLVLDGIPTKMK